jgi:hypothetical protein
MEARVYIRIHGDHFSPLEYQQGLDADVAGSVEAIKAMSGGTVTRVSDFWKSEEFSAEDPETVTRKLHELVSKLQPELLNLKDPTITKCAEVVIRYEHGEDHGGLYVPPETLVLLAKADVGLDIDEYFDAR